MCLLLVKCNVQNQKSVFSLFRVDLDEYMETI